MGTTPPRLFVSDKSSLLAIAERVLPGWPAGFAAQALTVHRLGIGAVLRRKLSTTNPTESCLSTVQRVARNVKRWREGNQPLRWTATGLLEAEKKFWRIKGYQELLLLKVRLNPSRLPQKEARALVA